MVNKSILVFRIGQLGDTLVSMPAMKEIHDYFFEYRLVLLTDRHPQRSGYLSSWGLLGPTGWFDDVIYYEPVRSLKGKVSNLFRVAKQIRKCEPDCVFLLAPERSFIQVQRDRLFFRWISGIPTIYGCSVTRNYRKRARGVLPWVEPEWRRLLHLVTNEDRPSTFVLPVPNEEREFALKMLEQSGISSGTPLIAFAPGSKMPSKRWPASRFALVGEDILSSYEDVHLVVLGGKEDSHLGDQLCQKWGGRSHNFAGNLSIYASAAVLSQCKLYIGNDTGTMHLASMVGTKCVALFSARDYPGQWEPCGDGHKILRHRTSCEGCMLTICVEQHMECIMSISTEDVLIPSKKLLNEILPNQESSTGNPPPFPNE